jgi:hypothetical protein
VGAGGKDILILLVGIDYRQEECESMYIEETESKKERIEEQLLFTLLHIPDKSLTDRQPSDLKR